MILLDAYPVLAFLKGESAADQVADLLRGSERQLTATGVAEVVDHLVRVAGLEPEQAVTDLASLGLLDAVEVSTSLGLAAGLLRARYYDRTRSPVSLADCVALECARSTGARLATSDPPLLAMCHAEGVATLVLPGSDGSSWSPG